MNYKLSVIIPCYNILGWKNGEILFDNAINSLKKQSIGFENLEIILVDDCSTDTTFKILDKTAKKHENIKCYSLEKNMGQGYARYFGVKKANSEYVMFLDGDDEYSSESCAKLYEIISKKNADIVNSNYIINLNGEKYTGFNYDLNYKEFKPETLKQFQKQYVLWARIFKKKNIENIENDLRALEDTFLNINAFYNAEKIIYVNDFYSCIHNVNYDSFTMKPSVNSIIRGFNQIDPVVKFVSEVEEDYDYFIHDLFSMILQDVLMYNFTYKENNKILKSFKKVKYEIMNKYTFSNNILNSPVWLKIINYFVDKELYIVISLIIRPVQLLLSNRLMFKFLFIHVQKHEQYLGKL